MEEEKNNLVGLLDHIEGLKDKKIKVYQASTGKNIDSSLLTFKQQKELISTVVDGPVGALKFQKILNDILLENTGNDELLISDKLPIILPIRCGSIGKEVKRDDKTFDITENITRSKSFTPPKFTKIKDKIDIELYYPTLKEENKVILRAIEILKKDGDDTGKSIGDIFTVEIVKYIKSVTYDGNELNFLELPINDRIKVVENMPLSLNKKIVNMIEGFKDAENKLLKIEEGEESIDIDISFFDN